VEPTILYNDGGVLAVDKPSGLLVAPDRWDKAADHVVRWVRQRVGTAWCNVHRLDKDTSGVVLFGCGPAMVAALSELFDSRQVTKVYEALVRGRPRRPRGAISAALSPDPRRPGRMITDPAGSPARTQYETRRTWPARVSRGAGVSPLSGGGDELSSFVDRPHGTHSAGETPAPRECWPAGGSLLELWPLTGRTHQLRVHLASIGCPILADPFYGAGEADHDVIPRLALHACRLTLTHPTTGLPVTIESPRPAAFEAAMATL